MTSPSPIQHFRVSPSQKGTKLSSFLAGQLDISGSRAKSLLDSRAVWVNGKRVWMAKHPLSPGDRVEVRVPQAPERTKQILEVLFEDDTVVAVNKPAGLISESHAASVESLLRKRHALPGLRALHRLDRETSGVLLFLKRPARRNRYVDLFKSHAVEKRYAVLLAGTLPATPREVRRRIDGKTAYSVFLRKTANAGFCRAECNIRTGRTHQIRKHALALDCRVLGEKQYTGGPELTRKEKAVPRQMLHAEALNFHCPQTGTPIEIQAPWPADFRNTAQQFHLLS